VSYQREDERYWTDYLRVALPIVGLLLLFGLLWFWLSSIIGDDNNDKPTATPTESVAVVVTQAIPTQTPVVETGITAEVQTPAPTQNPGGASTPPDEGNPTEAPANNGKFAKGDLVTVNDNQVNMRAKASTADDVEIVAQLDKGTELEITGNSKTADDLVWWPVTDNESGNSGWVAEQYLDAE
jgi:hypothetical protein